MVSAVARDLQDKLRLERRLERRLDPLFRETVRKVIRDTARHGAPLPDPAMADKIAAVLREHYDTTAAAFSGRINDKLPADKKLTTEEAALIAITMQQYFDRRAPDQGQRIADTTQEDIRTAHQRALQETTDQGAPLSVQERAAVTGAFVHHALQARKTSIAITETQAPAETTKATEAEVLSGLPPTASGRTPRIEEHPPKRWDSVGDSHTRPAHLAADGQEVPTNEPFIVDGERLMYPGDTSLGASAGNVINCRCIATYPADRIAARR